MEDELIVENGLSGKDLEISLFKFQVKQLRKENVELLIENHKLKMSNRDRVRDALEFKINRLNKSLENAEIVIRDLKLELKRFEKDHIACSKSLKNLLFAEKKCVKSHVRMNKLDHTSVKVLKSKLEYVDEEKEFWKSRSTNVGPVVVEEIQSPTNEHIVQMEIDTNNGFQDEDGKESYNDIVMIDKCPFCSDSNRKISQKKRKELLERKSAFLTFSKEKKSSYYDCCFRKKGKLPHLNNT